MTVFRFLNRIFVVLAFFGVVLLGGCDSGQDSQTIEHRIDPQKPTDNQQAIVLAVHPYASAVALTRQFSPLIEYLSDRVGIPFTLHISKNYEAHIAYVGDNKADIALMGPASYITMSEQYGKKRLLSCFEINGSSSFQGYIITHKENPATSLQDLQGKSFAASSRNSTMSYMVPRYMFIQAGIPFPHAQLQIVGSHNNVTLNVLAGDVNAGAIREKAYLKYKDRDLKVIAVTPKIIEHPFVATDKLAPETYALVKKALLDIKDKEDVEKILTPIKTTLTGLVPVEDQDYDQLRTIISVVRKDEKLSAEMGEVK